MGGDADEAARLESLADLAILDTPPEAVFDELARLAARLCGTPIAVLTLIDTGRQWYKARVGLSLGETSRDRAAFAAPHQPRHRHLSRDANPAHHLTGLPGTAALEVAGSPAA
jgi:hypothetical protein